MPTLRLILLSRQCIALYRLSHLLHHRLHLHHLFLLLHHDALHCKRFRSAGEGRREEAVVLHPTVVHGSLIWVWHDISLEATDGWNVLTAIRSMEASTATNRSSASLRSRTHMKLGRMLIQRWSSQPLHKTLPWPIGAILPTIPHVRIIHHLFVPHSSWSARCMSVPAEGPPLVLLGSRHFRRECSFHALWCVRPDWLITERCQCMRQ